MSITSKNVKTTSKHDHYLICKFMFETKHKKYAYKQLFKGFLNKRESLLNNSYDIKTQNG